MKPFFETLRCSIETSKKTLYETVKEDKGEHFIEVGQLKANLSKADMAKMIVTLYNQVAANIGVMKTSSAKVELLMERESDLLGNANDLQSKLLQKEDEQEKGVESDLKKTIKAELKTYATAVNKSSGGLSIRSIKTAVSEGVKSAAESVDRSKKFGLGEEPREDLEQRVGSLLISIGQKPQLQKVERFGKGTDRPVRVQFSTTQTVYDVIKQAKELKRSSRYSKVYISFDRSPEQRTEHRRLVEELKRRIALDPSQHYVIRGGKVLSRTELEAQYTC